MAGSEERDGVHIQPTAPTDSVPAAESGGVGGSATHDYGGMARDVTNVDTAGAADVGADPPGGLPIDFGSDTPDRITPGNQNDTPSAP